MNNKLFTVKNTNKLYINQIFKISMYSICDHENQYSKKYKVLPQAAGFDAGRVGGKAVRQKKPYK